MLGRGGWIEACWIETSWIKACWIERSWIKACWIEQQLGDGCWATTARPLVALISSDAGRALSASPVMAHGASADWVAGCTVIVSARAQCDSSSSPGQLSALRVICLILSALYASSCYTRALVLCGWAHYARGRIILARVIRGLVLCWWAHYARGRIIRTYNMLV